MLDDDSSISHPALERAAPLRAMRPDHAAVMRVQRGDNRGAKARHYRSASAKYRDQWPAGPDVIAPSSRFDKYGRSERYQGAAYALASLYRSLAAAQPFIRAWWRSEAPAEGTVIVTISEVASTVRIVFRIVISIVQKSANCVFRLHKSLHSFSRLQLTWDRVWLSPLSCVL